jgi:hypothetical protein
VSDLLELADAGAGTYTEVLPDRSEPVDPDYSNGVPVARHKHTDEAVRTPLDGTTRIGIIGESGSGKTTGIKRYVSVAYDLGYNILNGADAKNDFHGLDRKGGVSKQLREDMGLLPGEQPHPIPVELFQPLVLSKLYEKECSECGARFRESVRCPACDSDQYRGGRPSYLNSYSLRFNDLNKAELSELVNPSEAQQKVLDNLLAEVGVYNTSFSVLIETLTDWIDEGEVGSKRSAKSLRSSLAALQSKNVINNRTNPLSRVFQELDEQVVSLSIQNREQLPSGSEFANIVKLHIVKALQAWVQRVDRGELQDERNLWIGDECHSFIPAGTDDLLLRTITRLVNQDARQCGMAMLFSTQQPSQLPHKDSDDSANILGSLTHCFIGKSRTTLDESEWKPVLKAMNVYRGRRKELHRWRNKFARMDQHDFCFIDAQRHQSAADCPIVRFCSPVCHHPG